MSVIAVAGGSSGIGRSIVEAIVAQGKFDVIVLSRNSDKETEKRLGARVVATDYADVDGVVHLLEANNVHAIISALGANTPPETEQSLIRAADISATTRRFIPSVFGIKYTPDQTWFPPAASKIAAMASLEKSSLEWTAIYNGYFLGYWGMPKVKSYLNPVTMFLDIGAAKAGIPGSGATPAVFTYSGDVARFVAAALTLEKWETESYVIGTKVCWNDFVKIAEDVRGIQFDVTHDSLDALRSGKVTELPGHVLAYEFFPKEKLQGMFAMFGILFDEGKFDLQPEQSLNDLFPEIEPMSVKQMVEIGWKI